LTGYFRGTIYELSPDPMTVDKVCIVMGDI
jgi:hypothetical protein